jgi:hypothetical protein
VTTAAGNILYDLWDQVNPSTPVVMAKAFVETDARVVNRCRKHVSKQQARYRKAHYREWSRCFGRVAAGLSCDTATRDARIAAAAAKLSERLGGPRDTVCAKRNLTPSSLGHGSVCPAPCASLPLFDLGDLADCTRCLATSLNAEALESAYGAVPPASPPVASGDLPCQKALDKASGLLAGRWALALARCEHDNATGKNDPPVDCSTDPGGRIAAAKNAAGRKLNRCSSYAGLAGCASEGNEAAVRACIESSVGSTVAPYTEGAYP